MGNREGKKETEKNSSKLLQAEVLQLMDGDRNSKHVLRNRKILCKTIATLVLKYLALNRLLQFPRFEKSVIYCHLAEWPIECVEGKEAFRIQTLENS